MSYEVTLLVFGVLLLLIGLIGRVKAQQLEVGTENPVVRVVTAFVGLLFVVFSLNPDLPRSLLPVLKDANRGAADSSDVALSGSPAPAKPVAPSSAKPSPAPPDSPAPAKPVAPFPAKPSPAPPDTTAPVEPKREAGGNGFRDLDVSEVSPSEVMVSVGYTYTGNLGESPPVVPIVTANSRTNAAMVYEYINGLAKVGTGTASWRIYGDLTSPWESDELRFCIIDTSRANPPFCENLPYRKRWLVPARKAVPDNQIGNFRAQDVSSKELRVSVTYQYAGESGQRPFRVYMSAVALQSDNQQVPRTHFEGLGGAGPVRLGSGRSTMLINKYSDAAATSNSVRVCINSQNARGNLTQVLCEEFPHRKDWR